MASPAAHLPSILGLAALSFAFGAAVMRGTHPQGLRATIVPLSCAAVAGFLAASTSAAPIRSACVSDLQSGEAVRAYGRAREAVAPGRSVRITLVDAVVERASDGQRCRIEGLISRVDTVADRLPAGSGIAVRGEWVRLGHRGNWPRRPNRTGIVVGRAAERLSSRAAPIPPGSRIAGLLTRVRTAASERLRLRLPSDVSPIGRALILSERDELPGEIRRRFADAGLAHLLAISGLHVGLIAGALVLLLRTALGPSGAAVMAALLVALYVGAIGAPPSAVRASVLLAGWAAARTRGVRARPWDILGLAALIVLIDDPLTLVEPGFQLSFAGFAGLGAGAAAWRSLDRSRSAGGSRGHGVTWLRRLPRGIRRHLRLAGLAWFSSFGAFLATVPISAAHFQHAAPIALISHFVGTPLVAAAIAALAMTLFLPPPLHALAAGAASAILRWMVILVQWIAALPGGHTRVAAPGAAFWIAALLLCVAGWRSLKWRRLRPGLWPAVLGSALLVGGPALDRYGLGRGALLCTVDVGQGDAAALRTANGRWILFDSGPRFGRRDAGRDVLLPLLRRLGARRIDLFVLSHPDLDHVGGFEAVHGGMRVFRVLDSGHPVPTAAYARFLALVREDGIRWMSGRAGDLYQLDNVDLRVLGPIDSGRPDETHAVARAPKANETSLVLRVSIEGSLVYLNTGDATSEDERAILSTWGADSLRADVLKVGHHGSRTSTSASFLAAVRPALAVISAGRGNAYGHPHHAVLERLAAASVPRVWRTDREGTVCIEVDPRRGWRIEGEPAWRSGRAGGTRLDVLEE